MFNIGWRPKRMPLIKSTSKKAFEKNISTETRALEAKGKSKSKAAKQAAAIAFSEKREAAKKKKK